MKGSRMRNASPPVTDNIAEALVIIIRFTYARQKVLADNVDNANTSGYTPKDLDVDAFSTLMDNAINEHVRSKRLVLCDTDSIKFGAGGDINVDPVIDNYANVLRENDLTKYLELQANKLSENSFNYKVANELLIQKQGMLSTLNNYK